MSATPPPSAGARVAAIPELLEHILLNIVDDYIHTHGSDLRALLTSQRVSRAFRKTITGSSSLQRALWLAPSDPDYTPWPRAIDVNPMLARNLRKPENTEIMVDMFVEGSEYDAHGFFLAWKGRDNTDRSASWRRMYICRGAAGVKIEAKKVYSRGNGSFEMHGNWENPKAGDLFDYVSSRVEAEKKAKALVAE